MRPKSYFWGIFFISLGLLLLLQDLKVLYISFADNLQLWPIVIIIFGICFLKIPRFIKSILSGIAGLIMAGFIVGIISSHGLIPGNFSVNFPDNINFDDKTYSDSLNESVSLPQPVGIILAKLNFSGGAGKYIFSDSASDKLIDIRSHEKRDNIEISSEVKDSVAEIHYESNFNNIMMKKNVRHGSRILLSGKIPWELKMDAGASKLLCDFTKNIIRKIDFDGGACSINFKIGDRSDTTLMTFDIGASALKIQIPETSACEIECETGLSSRSFPNFHLVSENVWQTENFNTSVKKVFIKISGGVSSFKVERYKIN
ncbi:MAG: DUF5668 domain-containing protein [Candidatus Kapabacteria bacterium]|nr:DUF5668 domain-containing protein [Candidatus Kapabacteria bacterium]